MRRVLILDDDPVVLNLLVEFLRGPRLHLVTCSELEAAECLLDRDPFDVLVTDLAVSNLGGAEGFRLVRHARAHFPNLQVIVYSGMLNDELRDRGLALGVIDLLDKPTGLLRLKDLIEVGSPDPARDPAGRGEVTRVATLEEVLANHAISAVLQPIVALDRAVSSRALLGVEGLARGPEDLGLRSPELLLGYAARKERLFEAELQCVEAVLGEARHLPGIGKLFINMSPRALSAPGAATVLADLVSHHGYRYDDIVLELTEEQSILNLPAFDETLNDLREKGFGLALDDYGSGYANLQLVQQLPLDYLKIDGLFARDLPVDLRKQAIVSSAIEMAHELGISTIMEHVETAEELEIVENLGAAFAQGYYFSAPRPARELASSFEPRP